MKKKRLITTFLVLTLFTISSSVYADNENSTLISADAGILMDAETGQVLYEKNMHKKEYPASITKIMTILLGVESNRTQENIVMSRNAVFSIPRDSAHIALDEGEEIQLEDALYGAMLPSANEACNGIAEHLSGSVSEFAKLMNQRAVSAGAQNTHFANPNGLHDPNHQTTAYDMAMITRDALKNPDFRKIFGTTSYQIPPTNKQSEIRYLWTTHRMLKESEFYYEKAIGGKTGYTTEALNTLVTVANNGDRELIVVLLRNHSGRSNYNDTKALFEYGFNSFNSANLSNAELLNSYPETEKDYELVSNTLISNLQKSNFLLYKKLTDSDVSVKFENFSSLENAKEFTYSVNLKEDSSFMYKNIGSISFKIENPKPISKNIFSKLKFEPSSILSIILKIIIFVVIALVIIYFYVNRNYYRKRILKKYKKSKNKKLNPSRKKREIM